MLACKKDCWFDFREIYYGIKCSCDHFRKTKFDIGERFSHFCMFSKCTSWRSQLIQSNYYGIKCSWYHFRRHIASSLHLVGSWFTWYFATNGCEVLGKNLGEKVKSRAYMSIRWGVPLWPIRDHPSPKTETRRTPFGQDPETDLYGAVPSGIIRLWCM